MSKYLSYREPLYAHRKGESWGLDRKHLRECLRGVEGQIWKLTETSLWPHPLCRRCVLIGKAWLTAAAHTQGTALHDWEWAGEGTQSMNLKEQCHLPWVPNHSRPRRGAGMTLYRTTERPALCYSKRKLFLLSNTVIKQTLTSWRKMFKSKCHRP